MPVIPPVLFPSGEERPALGLGTAGLGAAPDRAAAEVAALRQAVDMGYRVFDTAEMYADGGAEVLLGQALAQAQRAGVARDSLFVVSKVLPHNAGEQAVVEACERSLARLQLDCIDLYLLHWPGPAPLEETVRGFELLERRGLIRHWGVSNFDMAALRRLSMVPGGAHCAANQVHYSLGARGAGFDLLPWQALKQMPLMAYSPFDQGELADHPGLRVLAQKHRATPAQIALAWLLRQPGVMAIPKAASVLHLRHNWAAQDLQLDARDLAALDKHFPPPHSSVPLSTR
jgi:diketogulonate reductase-like aldo/keto reductase